MPDRRLLLLPLLAVVPLLPLFGADEAEQRRALDKMRTANPAQFARLRQEARAFLALPAIRRERLLKLERDLHEQPSSVQKHLFEVMQRYADWLEQLPEDQRQEVLKTRDQKQRLELIRRLREQQWLRSQPKRVQVQAEQLRRAKPLAALTRILGQFAAPRNVAPLTGLAALLAPRLEPTADFLARVKREEQRRRQDWRIAARHWGDLVEHPPKEGLPNRPGHFGKDVEEYVTRYLRYLVSREEWARLEAAAGQWPEYPYLLVELADRYPPALPGPRGIDTAAKLPKAVKDRLATGFFPKKLVKGIDTVLHNRFKAAEGSNKWPKFGTAVAEFAALKNITLPGELWPTKPRDLSPKMQTFVKETLPPLLTRDEARDLKDAEGSWPTYPVKIQQLATKYHLRPPWQTLPGPRERWDAYRVRRQAALDGLPELPRPTLRDFALLELTPQERAALNLSVHDPASWHRLTARYFQEKPGELRRLRLVDAQHFLKHVPRGRYAPGGKQAIPPTHPVPRTSFPRRRTRRPSALARKIVRNWSIPLEAPARRPIN